MKIEIRDTREEDASFILDIENNKEIWKVSHTTEAFDIKDIEVFISGNSIGGINGGQKRWMITKNSEVCGCIDLFDYDKKNKRAGIGIVVHPDYQNQGIAGKALELFVKFCKQELQLHQLYCTILADNPFSIKLFESCGFIKTGERKEWTFYQEEYFDEFFYQLIF